MGNQNRTKNINLTKHIRYFSASLISQPMFGFEVNNKRKHFSDNFKILGIVTSKLGKLNIKSFDNMEKCINNQG